MLVRLAGGQLNRMKALELLYIANRCSLLETGCNMFQLNRHSFQLLFSCLTLPPWTSYLATDGDDLIFKQDPGDSELSDYDVQMLMATIRVKG
jgi:hypothetical protein